jgi:hypothetical protein
VITSIFFSYAVNDTNGYSKDVATNVGGADACYVMVDFTIPIAEWAGSGTVNLAQNDVEYAYNNSTSTTSDTTSFAYGPAGSQFYAFAPSGTDIITKRVKFQTPIQDRDLLFLEISHIKNLIYQNQKKKKK